MSVLELKAVARMAFPPVSRISRSSPASRSYVLASLRALHLDPASGPAQSRDHEGKAKCEGSGSTTRSPVRVLP
jgi:hypothetical protein